MIGIKKITWITITLILIAQTACAKKPNHYAVVIGCCEEYANGEFDALHAKDDAQNFYDDLIERYYEGNSSLAKDKVYLLTEKKATRAKIKASLKAIVQRAKKGDYLYFFFSGHGSSLSDKEIKIDEYNTKELMKLMHNSGLIIPYDFNINQTTKTAIIGSRDLKENNGYGFQKLDTNGVQVIMISDSCYSGNIYRQSAKSSKKFIPKNQLKGIEDEFASIAKLGNKNRKEEKDDYENLIFFGAGAMDKSVAEDSRRKRGKFSLVVQRCLDTANLNNDKKITNQEFRECLKSEDSAKAFVYYPDKDQRTEHVVFETKRKNIVVKPSEQLHVKSSLRAVAQLDGVVIDAKNYDIEISSDGKNYSIFRYTGELYASIDPKNLKAYIEAFKLFKLEGKSKLNMKVESLNTGKSESPYCKDEKLIVDIENRDVGDYIVALTLSKEGGMIMLKPNDYESSTLSIVRTNVEYPFGMDKLKVFALSNKKQYNEVKTLVRSGGHLQSYDVSKLYNILKKDKSYQEAELDIQTIETDIDLCLKGERK
jgi:hypothetical protein